MNTIEVIGERRVGFSHAHPQDQALHAGLLAELGDTPVWSMVHRFTEREGGAVRLIGERTLAQRAAEWAEAYGIEVLVTPPPTGHPEHGAAAHAGRLAAALLWERGYKLDVLTPEPSAGNASAWRPLAQTVHTAEQPLTPADFMTPRAPLEHPAALDLATYRHIPAGSLAVAANTLYYGQG